MAFWENPTPIETTEIKKETTENNNTKDFSKLSLQLKEIQQLEQEDKTDNPDDYLEALWLDMEVDYQTEEDLDNFIKEVINIVHDAKISDKSLNKFSSIINDLKPKILNWEDIRDELFNKIQEEIPEEYKYITNSLVDWVIINGKLVDFERYLSNFTIEPKEEYKTVEAVIKPNSHTNQTKPWSKPTDPINVPKAPKYSVNPWDWEF